MAKKSNTEQKKQRKIPKNIGHIKRTAGEITKKHVAPAAGKYVGYPVERQVKPILAGAAITFLVNELLPKIPGVAPWIREHLTLWGANILGGFGAVINTRTYRPNTSPARFVTKIATSLIAAGITGASTTAIQKALEMEDNVFAATIGQAVTPVVQDTIESFVSPAIQSGLKGQARFFKKVWTATGQQLRERPTEEAEDDVFGGFEPINADDPYQADPEAGLGLGQGR